MDALASGLDSVLLSRVDNVSGGKLTRSTPILPRPATAVGVLKWVVLMMLMMVTLLALGCGRVP